MKPQLVTLEGNELDSDSLVYLEGNFFPSSYDDVFLYGDFYPDLAAYNTKNFLNGNEELGFAWLRFAKLPRFQIPRGRLPSFKPSPIKAPSLKPIKISNPLKKIRIRADIGKPIKDLQRGISSGARGILKEGQKGIKNLQSELSRGAKTYFDNYKKAFKDVGTELQRGVGQAGNLFQSNESQEELEEPEEIESNEFQESEEFEESEESFSDDDETEELEEQGEDVEELSGQFDNLFSTIGAGVGTSFAPGIGASIGSEAGKLFSTVLDKKLGTAPKPKRKIKMAINPKTKKVKLSSSRDFTPEPPPPPSDSEKIFGIDKKLALGGAALAGVALLMYMNKGKRRR